MTPKMQGSRNPHDICTWRPESECADCSLSGRLKCRFRAGDLFHFLGMFGGFALPAVHWREPGRLWPVASGLGCFLPDFL